MANAVSKDEVKAFLILFRKALDARYAAQFAPAPALNSVKSDLGTLEDEVAQINTNNFVLQEDGKGLSTEDFATEEKKLLAALAKETTSGFDAQDLLDIFDD